MRKKAVPVGIEDFERIINEDYYYVDKTMLIEEFTKALLGKKKFLEMPRDINSYLEVEINDL